MSLEVSQALRQNINIAWRMSSVMQRYFGQEELAETIKADKTSVTEADLAISNEVVELFTAIGRKVVSEEEGRTAEYGDGDAEYLDPIDGTYDFIRARQLGHFSLAAFSLGSVVEGQFVRGVVALPLLARPYLLWSEAGKGSFQLVEKMARPAG